VGEPGPDGDWTLAVLDTTRRLPAGYEPSDLVPISLSGLRGGGSIRRVVLDDLTALAVAAKRNRIPLVVRSAYRSEARQRVVFTEWVGLAGLRAAVRGSARPGHSEHQLGTTIDFAAGSDAPWAGDFGATRTGRWLARHGPQFGFVMSYPAGSFRVTCYQAEPWHFRWVGREAAREVVASGLTLREWLWLVSNPMIGGDHK
jgi:D-alanyl-D-alanine carboxypeptidase